MVATSKLSSRLGSVLIPTTTTRACLYSVIIGNLLHATTRSHSWDSIFSSSATGTLVALLAAVRIGLAGSLHNRKLVLLRTLPASGGRSCPFGCHEDIQRLPRLW